MRIILIGDSICSAVIVGGFVHMFAIAVRNPIPPAIFALNVTCILGAELLQRFAFVCITFLPFYVRFLAAFVVLIICVAIHFIIAMQNEGNIDEDERAEFISCAFFIVAWFYIRALLFFSMFLTALLITSNTPEFIACVNATFHFLFDFVE